MERPLRASDGNFLHGKESQKNHWQSSSSLLGGIFFAIVHQCLDYQENQKGEAEWPAACTNFRTLPNDHLVSALKANVEMRRGKREYSVEMSHSLI